MKNKLLSGKKLEWAGLILFAAAYVVISAFHEPWFDEAQAWQIAKCASLREILFEIPHYEGHPPLWHLILAIPAKLGVPFEIGLKTVGFLFSAVSAYLILFRMPYPRLMRLLIPFSYFVFYQYGVIVRPYGLMLLVFLFLALAFPKKDIRPWRFVGLLMLLCLTNAYGIVIAGGIAVCWVWELAREKGMKNLLAGLLKDGRSLALSALLVFAILLVWLILPRRDTLVYTENRSNSFILCLICALFSFMGECTLSTSSWFVTDRVLLQHASMQYSEFAVVCLFGLFLWFLMLCISSKRVLKYLLIPYCLFAMFAAAVFFNVHHLGIVLLFLLFWFGLLFQDEQRFEIGKAALERMAKTERDRGLIKKTSLFVFCACLLVPIYWCGQSAVLEVKKEYSYGRSGSSFLKEYGLENCRVFSAWGEPVSLEEKGNEPRIYRNSYYVFIPVLLNAYFDHNIAYNLNLGDSSKAYMISKTADEYEDAHNIECWGKKGLPDIIIGKQDLNQVFEDFKYEDYTIVYGLWNNYIWKGSTSTMLFPVFAKTSIMEEYGLKPSSDMSILLMTNGFQITEEMREAYEKGIPVEEIVLPYLEGVFEENG